MFLLLAGAVNIIAQVPGKKLSAKEQKRQERKEHINQLIKQEEEGALVYSKQSAFGIKLNTDGYGIFYEHGKYKTLEKTNIWWLELGEHKDPKEEKITVTDGSGFYQVGNPYIFGKINNFYYFKIGIGQQLLIGGKGNRNGVAVSLLYGGGISAGFLKPYYLDAFDSTGVEANIKYSSATDYIYRSGDLSQGGLIIGSAGFTRGFNSLKFIPGIHARVSLRFDYGRYNELLSAIEVGVNAAYYTKNVNMLLDNPGKKFFFTSYVALDFGKRK